MVHELFPFDPNTAAMHHFERLGLEELANQKHLPIPGEKASIFSRPSDFARVYGITKKTFEVLFPFIRIADDYKQALRVIMEKKDMREAKEEIHLIIIR